MQIFAGSVVQSELQNFCIHLGGCFFIVARTTSWSQGSDRRQIEEGNPGLVPPRMMPRSTRVSEARGFVPDTEEEEYVTRWNEAEKVVRTCGVASIQEELSRPKLEDQQNPLLPFIAVSVLDVSDGATFESIDFQEHCVGEDSDVLFERTSRTLKYNVLKTGCKAIDNILGGGICVSGGSIIEISGKAGVGKTQLAMQMALMTTAPLQRSGLQSNCVYVFIEGPTPIKRMTEIENALCSRFGLTSGTLLHGIVVEEIRSADQLLVWSETRLPYLLRKTNARVVVIDSIAAVYRPEFQDALSRTRHLARMSAALKRAMASVEGVCICVNQVSQKVDSIGFGHVVPALGSVWGNTIETRIFLRRSGTRRFAKILDSAHLYDTEEEEFQICKEGVLSVDESDT
ncbi:DNA recombination and repair protein Rad51-like protein [Gracilaria domingensis]|nr:DNA recombination and repair protein Rad51-like protein [Gracilaria domingensis]